MKGKSKSARIDAVYEVHSSLNHDSKYRLIIENANEGIIVIQDGRLKFFNPKIVEITGYNEGELLDMPFQRIMHPQDRAFVLKNYLKLLHLEGPPEKFEFRIVRKDGETRWVEVKPVLIYWDERPASLNFLSDITYHKKEERLREALYKIATITNTTSNLKEFFSEIHSIVGELMYAENFFIVLLTDEDGLQFAYFVDERKKGAKKKKCEEALIMKVIKEGKPILCSPCVLRRLRSTGEVASTCPVCESWLGVPLKSDEDIIGVLGVQSYDKSKVFTNRDVEILTFVSHHIATAINRKRAQETLKESELRFRMLVETAQDAIILANDKGEIINWNRGAESIFGYKEKEIIGKPITILIPESYRKKVEDNLKKINNIKRNKTLEAPREKVGLRKDGTEFPAEVAVSAWKLRGKMFFTVIARDITERKLKEAMLMESEERFRRIVENSHEGIVIIDDSRRLVYANQQLCEMVGYALDELIGIDYRKLIYEEDVELVDERYRNRQRGEKVPPIYEFRLKCKDGGVRWVETSSAVVKDSKGRVLSIAQLLDITERKRKEREIRERKAYLENVLESVLDAVVTHDLEGKILEWNRGAERLFGYKREEVIGKELDKIIAGYNKQKYKEARSLTSKYVHGMHLRPLDTVRYRKDGTPVDVIVSGAPIVVDGKVIGVAVVYKDITDRKRAERKLRESYVKLRKALRGTIEAMARIVEMRDPYTAGHQQRVAKLAGEIAKEMGLSRETIQGIKMAGLIHDIGKIYVPAEILAKPAPLSEIEKRLIESHPQVGYEILKGIEFPWPVAEIVYQHHERLDGSGYPRGLKGEEILLEAQILGVADVVEAMSSHRPYRPAVGIEKGLNEILKNRGELYREDVVDVCIRVFREKGFTF